MDPFVLTIIIIFSAGIVISVLRTTAKDPCMKDFCKDNIVILMKSNRPVFGKLELTSSGLILDYKEPYRSNGHYETSFIIYKNEFAAIKRVIRIVDDLNDIENRRRVLRSLMIEKGFLSAIRRFFRNLFALLRDSIVDTFRLYIGRTSPKSSVLSSGGTYINKVGESFVDYVGNAYDPILEKLIGKEVVVEVSENGTWKENLGVLRNYSKDFIELLSIKMPFSLELPINNKVFSHFDLSLDIGENELIIKNQRKNKIGVSITEDSKDIEPGKTAVLKVISRDKPIKIVFHEVIDIIFPRSEAIIRHNTPECSEN
ncbi:MAG: hypothetical protein R6U52_10305 [Kosmotogaceae bacterium]